MKEGIIEGVGSGGGLISTKVFVLLFKNEI